MDNKAGQSEDGEKLGGLNFVPCAQT